jgi:hypothetical protein
MKGNIVQNTPLLQAFLSRDLLLVYLLSDTQQKPSNTSSKLSHFVRDNLVAASASPKPTTHGLFGPVKTTPHGKG